VAQLIYNRGGAHAVMPQQNSTSCKYMNSKAWRPGLILVRRRPAHRRNPSSINANVPRT